MAQPDWGNAVAIVRYVFEKKMRQSARDSSRVFNPEAVITIIRDIET